MQNNFIKKNSLPKKFIPDINPIKVEKNLLFGKNIFYKRYKTI